VTTPNDSDLLLVDSFGWIEYFGEGPKAATYAPLLEREDSVLLPTIIFYEVYKKLRRVNGEAVAGRFLSYAFRNRLVGLDVHLAHAAATVALQTRLAMADAIIYATARSFQAELITSDAHFQGMPGVTLV
jgi:predicted nucleic acid-binding protein